MNKLYILTIIISLFCNSLYSQWAPIGAKWYYDHTSGAPQYLTVIESINDTLVLNKQCKVLKTYTIYVLGISPGIYQWDTLYCPLQYTYYDSSKVYLYDNILNDFYILYDFNAAAGDTITVKDSLFQGYCPDNFPGNLFQYKVDSISDTTINGINLKKQIVTTTQNSDWFITDPYSPQGYYPIIIERIGAFKYLFGAGSFVEGSISHLRCYEDSSISYHAPDWPDTLACDYLYTLITNIKKIKDNNLITIFPNPAFDMVNISLSSQDINTIYHLEIYDCFGNLIRKTELDKSNENSNYNFNVHSLSAGIYLIRVNTSCGFFESKFIKIN
ncbi:MAG: T9SS type A sorting domain-containing protein [Methanomicrobium sp.]|nr:T9SS type A sorting domain-containing protein [Methanomicrobium sp.]